MQCTGCGVSSSGVDTTTGCSRCGGREFHIIKQDFFVHKKTGKTAVVETERSSYILEKDVKKIEKKVTAVDALKIVELAKAGQEASKSLTVLKKGLKETHVVYNRREYVRRVMISEIKELKRALKKRHPKAIEESLRQDLKNARLTFKDTMTYPRARQQMHNSYMRRIWREKNILKSWYDEVEELGLDYKELLSIDINSLYSDE